MNLIYGDAFMAALAVLGAMLAFRARGIRNWLVRLYRNQQIASHVRVPGYVLSLRPIGAVLLLLSVIGLAVQIGGQVSN